MTKMTAEQRAVACAFPRAQNTAQTGASDFIYDAGAPGMSVRTYIAAKVMPAIIRQCAGDLVVNGGNLKAEEYFAQKAVACADALIEELSK